MSVDASSLETTADVRDHMRDALELIADTEHVANERTHYVRGDRASRAGLGNSADLLWWERGYTIFDPNTCPVCIALRCLEQIDAAEEREGGLL